MGNDHRVSERRWRRRNDAQGARDNRVVMKLSDREFALLSAEASVRKCSRQTVLMSAWRSRGGDTAKRVQLLQDDLMAARRLLARVSANLNQAVKLEHTRRLEGVASGSQFEEDLRVVVRDLDVVMQDVNRVTGQVGWETAQ